MTRRPHGPVLPGPAAVPPNLFELGALQQALINAACRVEEMQTAHVGRIEQLEAEVATLRQTAARNADCHRRDFQRLVQTVGLLRRIVAGLDQLSQFGRGWVLVIPGLGNAIDEARAMVVGFEGKT